MPYSTLRTLADLDPAVESVIGYTLYRLDGGEDLSSATLEVVGRGGIGAELHSRTETDPRLRGTKALVAREQELMVAAGRSDGRQVIIVPEVTRGVPVGLVLLHVELTDHLNAATARSVLQGYRRRYQALRDAVTETEEQLDEQGARGTDDARPPHRADPRPRRPMEELNRAERSTVVVGVGIDLCEVSRLAEALARTPGLVGRLFTRREQLALERLGNASATAAAQMYAVKEAVMKSLGVGFDVVGFDTVEVDLDGAGVKLYGAGAARAIEVHAREFEVDIDIMEGPDGPVTVAEVLALG